MFSQQYLHGTVIKGEQWGKMIGFPTANLSHEYFGKHPVSSGVYAAWTWVGRAAYPSTAIVGIRHLAAPKQKKIEAHIIGKRLELYGMTLTVELVAKLRNITPFKDMPSLVTQIKKDNRAALAMLKQVRADRKKRSVLLVAAIRQGMPVLHEAFHRLINRGFLPALKAGMTEETVAKQLLGFFSAKGYRSSFPPPKIIVAFGSNAATPHHAYTHRRLKKGDCIKVDVGIRVDGWCTDVTRTLFFGQPTDRQRSVYQTVLRAQESAVRATRAGETAGHVDERARSVIAAAGYTRRFVHGTGHGLGTKIHEPPSLRLGNDVEHLWPGDVITIEPGIYIPQWGGVRVEDMVLVADHGARILSSSIPNDLQSVVIRT